MFKFETKEELIDFLNSNEGDGFEISQQIKRGLLNKRDALLSELKTLKEFTRKFENVDIDDLKSKASKLSEYEKEIEKLKANTNNSDERVEELKRSMNEQLEAEKTKYNQFVKRYAESNIDSKIVQAISKNKGIPELLKAVVKERVKYTVDDNGDIKMEVLSKEGKPLFVNGSEGTLDDVIQELRSNDIYSRAFEGSGSSGSGTRSSSAKATGVILDPNEEGYSLTKAMEYYSRNPQAK